MSRSNPDTFDVFDFKYYEGPNPYLNTGALVFDFALRSEGNPCKISTYIDDMARDLPQIKGLKPKNYGELFAQTCAEVSRLEMDLHLERWSLQPGEKEDTIAIQCLDEATTRGIINFVWDWLEAITHEESFDVPSEISRLQSSFRNSVYGGPTMYSLLQTAYHEGIPTFYLPDERMFQYGYGKYHRRGTGTTFDCDSQLDSDFTTLKDDCKAFLGNCGFPVPQGRIIYTVGEALDAIGEIGYPVAVKPVVGHKGIGVTANVQDDKGLEFAFETAKDALEEGTSSIIVEQSITGADYRLLCVGGKFVAAVERKPPYVVGDGESTIKALIDLENDTEARLDTPTSALGKIITDQIMENYLDEQGLSVESVPEQGQTVYLRKVANLSSGGVSIDATRTIHPDNMILAQDIAQYFQLACMGVDVIAQDIARSWKEGDFGIIEINAAPGVFMHLNPAVGDSVDVPGRILDYLFPPENPCRIPIITFNKLYRSDIYEIVDHILLRYPHWNIGSVCRDGIWLNRSEKVLRKDYNSNVKSLLRHPQLDLLIAEYTEDIFKSDGMAYEESNLVILEDPTPTEIILARDLMSNGTLIIKQGQDISVKVQGLMESYRLAEAELFSYVYLKEMTRTILAVNG
ncbi:MAG: cyanophycin synthetase [Microcystaceae cyanobacterium]